MEALVQEKPSMFLSGCEFYKQYQPFRQDSSTGGTTIMVAPNHALIGFEDCSTGEKWCLVI